MQEYIDNLTISSMVNNLSPELIDEQDDNNRYRIEKLINTTNIIKAKPVKRNNSTEPIIKKIRGKMDKLIE
jgi:hypothetical protein